VNRERKRQGESAEELGLKLVRLWKGVHSVVAELKRRDQFEKAKARIGTDLPEPVLKVLSENL
jgi:hypothetical protein